MPTLGDTERAVRESKTGFSFSFYGNLCKTGVEIADVHKKEEKKNMWSLRGIPERIRRSFRRWTLQKLSQSLVCQMVHTNTWSLQEVVPARTIQ